jgi:hypothetical protein
MIDAQSRAVLQSLIQSESHSLLHYVCESFPWISPSEQEALARLQQINQEEVEALAVLVRFLYKHRIVPAALGSYPMSFTNINYTALDHLLPILIDHQKGRIGDLQKDLAKIKDAEARGHVEKFLAIEPNHLQALEEMAQSLKVAGQSASFVSSGVK